MQIVTGTWATTTDEALARAFVAGRHAAFDELASRYRGPVYAYCLRLLGRPEDAEDLVQDVFVQLLRSLPSARTDVPLRPWIFVIARNKCLDQHKRRRSIPFTDAVTGDEPVAELPDQRPLPDEVAERAELTHQIRREIAALPERYRRVVALRYAGELSFAEIGNVLDLPENTVKTHFQRAKALLRQRLAAA